MKNLFIKSELAPTRKWWIHEGEQRTAEFYLRDPVCKLAEMKFLAFLIYLEKSGHDVYKFLSRIKIYSYSNRRKSSIEQTIQKSFIRGENKEVYPFGLSTRLVLTGKLAGTVVYSGFSSSEIAIRPLFDNPNTLEEINFSIRHLGERGNQVYDYNNYINILELCRELIDKHGYVHALIIALSALDIPADFEHIEENANTMNNIVTPTPEETKQFSKTHA